MTVSGPGPVARNEATEVFFDGTARGEFLLMRCENGHWNRPQAERCADCDSGDLHPGAASGRARLVSWIVVHPRPAADGATAAPTMPGIVELEEGPWWWAQIIGADPSELLEGLPLRVQFERPDGSETVPVFTPA
jgi:uncharacterized OB-fold protein